MNDDYENEEEQETGETPVAFHTDQTRDSDEASAQTAEHVRALEQKSREAAEANDKYLRTYADFENYRKRMQRDIADFRKYANEQMALDLLTVVDHLGLALKHAADAGGERNEGLHQGVELVFKQFRDVLEKFGVKPFRSEGELFDPAKHDAVTQIATADAPENSVVQVFQDGYLYHEKILRHAKVGVAKKPAESEAGQDEDASEPVT